MPTPERTSFAEIVEAGRDLLEAGGTSQLTMQAVAHRVGVRAPSLYKRVRDREALLVAVADATVDELRQRLEAVGSDVPALVRAYRSYAHERPEAFRLMFSTRVSQDALDRAAVPVLRAATRLVGEGEALDAARLLTAWATGFVQMELAGAFRLAGDVDRAFTYGLRQLVTGLSSQQPPPRAGASTGLLVDEA